MSETVTETPSEIGPAGSSVSAEPEDATKPLPGTTEAEAGEHDDKPAPDPEEERKRAERRRENQRYGQMARLRYAEKARADALEARLREVEARTNPGGAQPSQEDLEQAIERAAEQKLAQRERETRFKEWDDKGQEEFGRERFLDACKTVADMAADPARRGLLVDVALDTENGHRAIMELADDPAEAERILNLPPHKMALALAKLGAPPPAKPVAVSNTPAPIRPPAVGRARGEPDPEKGSYNDFERWSSKVPWRR